MKTSLKGFREYLTAEKAQLLTAVKKQSGADNVGEFFSYLANVSESPCGAAAGFSGFIYYSETVAFWRKNRAKITRLMEEDAAGIGYSSTFEMVRNFNGLKDYEEEEIARALYGRYNDDLTHIYNVFAWYVLEAIAYDFSNYKYECEA